MLNPVQENMNENEGCYDLMIEEDCEYTPPLPPVELKLKKKNVPKEKEHKTNIDDFSQSMGIFVNEDPKNPVFALRVSKCSNLSLETTFNHFSKNNSYSVVVVGEEGEGHEYHNHAFIRGQGITKEHLTLDLKNIYPDAKGNKFFSISIARDANQLLKYTLKEGSFLHRGLPQSLIDLAYKLSTPKTDLKKRIVDLEDALKMGRIEFVDFIEKYIQIKVDHGQSIYRQHIIAYCTRLGMSCGAVSTRSYACDIKNSILNEN